MGVDQYDQRHSGQCAGAERNSNHDQGLAFAGKPAFQDRDDRSHADDDGRCRYQAKDANDPVCRWKAIGGGHALPFDG